MTRSINPTRIGQLTSRRDRVVHIRFSVSENAAIECAAAAAGFTLSAFMRSLALEGAGVHPFFTEEDDPILSLLLSELRAVGVNLNQVARQLNRNAHADATLRNSLYEVTGAVAALAVEFRGYAMRGSRRRRSGS